MAITVSCGNDMVNRSLVIKLLMRKYLSLVSGKCYNIFIKKHFNCIKIFMCLDCIKK
jgi:hypothetical protein